MLRFLKIQVYKGFFFCLALFVVVSYAEGQEMDTIEGDAASWQYFSDQVMGGKSSGNSKLLTEGGSSYRRLEGLVTTENNGGFIQIRSSVSKLAKDVTGLELVVRGNGQNYFVFLRTSGTVLPWQYYKAEFPTNSDWKTVQIRFSDFDRSSAWLRKTIVPDSIKSIGIVAFGRNHKALIDVKEITFF